jgi:hypothetical protein
MPYLHKTCSLLLLVGLVLLVTLTEAFAPKIATTSTTNNPHPALDRQPNIIRHLDRRVCALGSKDDDGEPEKTDNEQSDSTSAATEEEKTVPAPRKRTDIVNDEAKVNDALGLGRGAVLLTIAVLINIWFFTIPTEFRRTRLCNEFDTQAYPELCMTPKMFVNGISEYYKNGGLSTLKIVGPCVYTCRFAYPVSSSTSCLLYTGGGIKFDFSIEGRE